MLTMYKPFHKFATTGLFALGLSLIAYSAQATNLVTNGSFESYGGSAPKDYFVKVKPTDWSGGHQLTFVDAPGTADNGSYLSVYGPFPSTSPDGGNFIEADGNPNFSFAIHQTISGLTVGDSYTLSFYQAAGQQKGFTGDTTDQWIVSFGTDTQDSALMTDTSGGVVPWESQSMTFVADTTSQVLNFLAWGDGGSTVNLPPIAFLDGINLTRNQSVPEPMSLSLMGSGLLGLGALLFLRRRSKRSASV